jgi:hypothetical protein
MITDAQYQEFMMKLAADQAGKNPLMGLNEFEQSFLASFRQSSRPSLWFTEKRRLVTDKMWRKHGPDINFPHPQDNAECGVRSAELKADADGCEYFIREQPQRRCNEPAEWCERFAGRKGLRYCTAHKEQVEKRCPGMRFEVFERKETEATV